MTYLASHRNLEQSVIIQKSFFIKNIFILTPLLRQCWVQWSQTRPKTLNKNTEKVGQRVFCLEWRKASQDVKHKEQVLWPREPGSPVSHGVQQSSWAAAANFPGAVVFPAPKNTLMSGLSFPYLSSGSLGPFVGPPSPDVYKHNT